MSESMASHSAIWTIQLRVGTLVMVNEEQGIHRGEVLAMMTALADIHAETGEILAILRDEDDDEEEEANS